MNFARGHGAADSAFAGTLDKFAARFEARVRDEHDHFAALSTALGCAADNCPSLLEDIHRRAHRLKGAAAMFEFAELAAAAGTLERATIAAVVPNAHDTGSVGAALATLMEILERIASPAAPEPGPV